MPTSVTMPALGESVTEGTVTRWLKQEGEQVEVDEPLLEVSTDKVDTEIPSPAAGVLRSWSPRTRPWRSARSWPSSAGTATGAGAVATPVRPTTPTPSRPPRSRSRTRPPSRRRSRPPPQRPAPASADSGSGGGAAGGDGEGAVTMPALGESVTEGTVTRWLKQEGEQVEVDEPLLEVSTDKVDTEILARRRRADEDPGLRGRDRGGRREARPHRWWWRCCRAGRGSAAGGAAAGGAEAGAPSRRPRSRSRPRPPRAARRRLRLERRAGPPGCPGGSALRR